MKRGFAFACVPFAFIAGVLAAGCGSSSPNVTVAITSPTSAQTIEAGQTVSIMATTTSNGASSGTSLTWSLNGVGCNGAACGTLSNETANSVTYNAPSMPPPANVTVYVVATSATNPPISASLSITVEAISVTLITKYTQLSAGSSPGGTPYFDARFGAQVRNDPSAQGVTWSLTASGTPCSPACGTLSGANPYGVLYQPPATVPAAPNNTPTLRATSISDPTQSDSDTFTLFDGATACGTGGNEGELNGQYAIMLQGWSGSGSAGNPLIFGASFAADGTGKITGGIDQFNPISNYSFEAQVIASASSYSVGPDNRGCLTLTDTYDDTFTFHFSLGGTSGGIASKGDIILFNAQPPAVFGFPTQVPTPEWASGILRLQDPTAFSLSALAANYAIGLEGWDETSGAVKHFALAGSFAQSGGNLPNPALDWNDGGKLSTMFEPGVNLSFGTIQQVYSTGTASTTLQLPGFGSINVEVYVISSSELFFISNDLASQGPAFCGRAIATSGSFTAASIAPNYIFRSTGSSTGAASASIGVVGFAGGGTTGTVSGKMYSYSSGAGTTQSVAGNYAFTPASGRLAVTGASEATSPVCYLANPFDGVAAFCIGTDSNASLGVLDTQPAATYGNSSVSGNFFFGSGEPGDSSVPDLSGIASISAGNLTGTQDTSGPNGLNLGSAISAALSINPDGTGTMGPNGVMVTNGTEIYFINEANGAPPGLQIFQQ